MKKSIFLFVAISLSLVAQLYAQVPMPTLIQIVRAEDERRWDAMLENLLKSPSAKIRERAALAAGRIGDEKCLTALDPLLSDKSTAVTAMFAIGEVESANGSDVVLEILKDANASAELRARALEAAGKIIAANPADGRSAGLGQQIISTLDTESAKANPDKLTVLLGITALLRAHPKGSEEITAKFLSSPDARIRTDALNTLARLRAKTVNDKSRELLKNDPDPVVRANVARMLGVGEDKSAIDLLLKAVASDPDSRVQVSAIRSLGALKDASVAEKVVSTQVMARVMADEACAVSSRSAPRTGVIDSCNRFKNTGLEIASMLARLVPNSSNQRAVDFLNALNDADNYQSPETDIALARIAPAVYVNQVIDNPGKFLGQGWRQASAAYQGLGELAKLESNGTNNELKAGVRVMLVQRIGAWADLPAREKDKNPGALAIPDLLTAFAAFKSDNTSNIMRPLLSLEPDEQIRATIAGILADQPTSKENVEALQKAFSAALIGDKSSNDAQLAILDALFKLDKKESVGTLLVALNAQDYLVRKRAYALLKTKDLDKDFPGIPTSLELFLSKKKNQILPYSPAFGTKLGQILNTQADYTRALSRKNGSVKAVFATTKGKFTIIFSPEEAPLTVDNFIKLARANYFNGVYVHRVVPNFVMQDGDPRGDGNGGPGWEIRCEINTLPYDRGAVGMALSGKDTGGSQWFVTHSPQPHLDGGYTVFGKVNEMDMKVVDSIARGDKIVSVKIVETGGAKAAIKKR